MIQTEREYAQALFSLAVEENAAGQYRQCLLSVRELLEENPDYIRLLSSPAIPLAQRLQAVDEAFEGRMPEYVVSFLKVLCENGKARTAIACIDEFLRLVMEYSDTARAVIYSAVALNETQKAALCKKLTALTKKSIDPVYIIDESLIGGMKIEVDGKTYDSSLRHRLGEIKDVMSS